MIKKLDISLNHTIKQAEGNIVSDMGGERVMLSVKNGKYYNLGEMGGAIWDLIEKPVSVNYLVTELISEYEVEKSQCEEQVISFLGGLWKEGLISIDE